MDSKGDSTLPEHLRRGRDGEALAVYYLREKGWTIEITNYETEFGEIDIIARRSLEDGSGDMVAFVEVKTRSSSGRMSPELAVTASKRRRITRIAKYYEQRHGRARTGYRFDVIGIDFGEDPPQIRHFEAAFDVSGNPY